MDEAKTDFEEVVALALKLSPIEKIRLVERVAATLERTLQASQSVQRSSLYGFLADLGLGPTEEDIDEIRHEMWNNFPREDIM